MLSPLFSLNFKVFVVYANSNNILMNKPSNSHFGLLCEKCLSVSVVRIV
jgi:hypothetical protein